MTSILRFLAVAVGSSLLGALITLLSLARSKTRPVREHAEEPEAELEDEAEYQQLLAKARARGSRGEPTAREAGAREEEEKWQALIAVDSDR